MNLIKTQFNRDYFPELANTKVVISCAVLPKADGSIDSIEVHIIRPDSIMEERKNLYIEHICEILKKLRNGKYSPYAIKSGKPNGGQ